MSKPNKVEHVIGIHAVVALLTHVPQRVLTVFLQEGRDDARVDAIVSLATQHGVRLQRTKKETISQLAADLPHQGVAAQIKPALARRESEIEGLLEKSARPLVLVLDSVQDPHNLGACLRSAEAAGATMLIAPKDKAAGLTPVVRKASCGAAELIPFIQVTNLARSLEKLQGCGLWTIGATGEAEKTIYDTDLSANTAIVLGAEGSGLRRLTRKHCDELVKIPMLGRMESVNVSVAAGICLFEAVRQRR